MHAAKIITETHLSRRLIKLAAFRNDAKVGPTRALKRAFDSLVASDELREMPKVQMQANFQTNARAFVIGNHERFFAALKR